MMKHALHLYRHRSESTKSKPSVPLERLDELSGGIIIRDVEPEAMGNSGWCALAETEGISTNKVGTISVWIVKGVEEKRRGWSQKVLDVLLKRVDVLASWILSNLPLFTKIQTNKATKLY